MSEQPVCFIIMPFKDYDGYKEGHFSRVYEYIFKPAVEAAGYKPYRVDDDLSSTQILGNIVTNLYEADMVLCDLSCHNPNVFYELGIRQAFEKPVVLVHEEGTPFAFDTSNLKTYSYCNDLEYQHVLEAQRAITKAISATADKDIYSIIQLARINKATISAENANTSELLYMGLSQQIAELAKTVEQMPRSGNRNGTIYSDDREKDYEQLRNITIESVCLYLEDEMDTVNNGDTAIDFIIQNKPRYDALMRIYSDIPSKIKSRWERQIHSIRSEWQDIERLALENLQSSDIENE